MFENWSVSDKITIYFIRNRKHEKRERKQELCKSATFNV